ncbi:hypothetical protein [Nostoc flagelliforme]|uniref:hypothetical protein n=1 Tax=Nostoc flagelliforme TaxID=1306274 RepID=UPI00142E89A4|nr:hypothetical protein [Nostoc flagelliforme]
MQKIYKYAGNDKPLPVYAPSQNLIIPPLNSEVAPLNTNCRVKRAIAPPLNSNCRAKRAIVPPLNSNCRVKRAIAPPLNSNCRVKRAIALFLFEN